MESDFIDYTDAYQSPRNPFQDKPEALLYKAVLENALLEFHKGSLVGDRRRARITREAWAWFCAEDYTWPFSFVNICSVWGLAPSEIRAHLGKHWRKIIEEAEQYSQAA